MEYYLDKRKDGNMLLNPFLTVNHKQHMYYFSEKYAQSQKNFLILKTTKGLDELVSNIQLNKKISQHLQYSFAISDNQKEFFSILEENVALCSTLVNKTMLAKFLMLKLHSATVELLNYSQLDLENLKNMLEVHLGTESQIVVIVYDKNSKLEDIQPLTKRGLVLLFEVCDGELSVVGPFVEMDAGTMGLGCYLEDKVVEKNVRKIEEYWNRPIEEIILDTTLSAITDYFSDYITASSPFMYRKVVVGKDSLSLCEAFSRN